MFWFGEPWPSGICYDDDDQPRLDQQIPVPLGAPCLWCEELIEPHDSGATMGYARLGSDGKPLYEEGYVHKECLARQTLGSVEHLEGRCSCHQTDPDRPERTLREEALATWAWIEKHRS